MREISLAILDVAQNSVDAKATLIVISVAVTEDRIAFEIADNGMGMNESQLIRAAEDGISFKGSTGMGLALLKSEVRQSDGEIEIVSKQDEGTSVKAIYRLQSPEAIGDMGATFVALTDEGYDTVLKLDIYGTKWCYDTRELKSSAGVAELQSSGALRLVREDLNKKINGGAML